MITRRYSVSPPRFLELSLQRTIRALALGVALLAASLFFGAEKATDPAAEPDHAWTVLTRGVAEPSVVKRSQAIAALGTMQGVPRAVDLLEPRLADKDWSIRQAAVIALGELKSRSSIPKLQNALKDETPDVSFTAAKALWDMGDQSGRDLFREILAGERSTSPGFVKGSIRDAKIKMHDRTALAMMGLKEGAGYALGPFSMGIVVVEDLVKDSGAPARTLCASLLGADTDPGSLSQLEEALTDKNWTVRVAVAKALGSRASKASLPKLEERLGDDHDAVRYMAAASIIRLTMPPPAPAVKKSVRRKSASTSAPGKATAAPKPSDKANAPAH